MINLLHKLQINIDCVNNVMGVTYFIINIWLKLWDSYLLKEGGDYAKKVYK